MRIKFLPSIIILALLAAGGCKEQRKMPQVAPVVTVASVKRADMTDIVTVIGKVKAYDKADLVARVSGFLVKNNFDEGAEVKKGDVLFLIEQDQYKADLMKAQGTLLSALATLKNADLEYVRQKGLYEKRAVSKRNYDDALADKMKADATVMQARSAVKLAELNLSYTEIKAPFDGYVGLENYSIGNYVGPTSGALTSVVSMSQVRVQFNISDKLVLKAREIGYDSVKGAGNVKVALYTADGVKYPHYGLISFWDNRIDQDTGTLTMQAMFPNPRLLLIPGMYAKVAINAEEKKGALVIPQISLSEDITGYFVMVVDSKNIVRRQKVTLGIKQGKIVEVTSGLKEGDRVIVAGLQHVRPGISVRLGSPKRAPGAAPAKKANKPAAKSQAKPKAKKQETV